MPKDKLPLWFLAFLYGWQQVKDVVTYKLSGHLRFILTSFVENYSFVRLVLLLAYRVYYRH